MLACEKKNTSFFAQLQNCAGLDLRDKRGKRHELAIILLGGYARGVSQSGRETVEYSSASAKTSGEALSFSRVRVAEKYFALAFTDRARQSCSPRIGPFDLCKLRDQIERKTEEMVCRGWQGAARKYRNGSEKRRSYGASRGAGNGRCAKSKLLQRTQSKRGRNRP